MVCLMSRSGSRPGANTRAIVLGAGGQDGFYLLQELAQNDTEVVGVVRQIPEDSRRFEHPNVQYCELDVRDHDALNAYLVETSATHIYHFAAVHGHTGSTFEENWRQMLDVNVASLHVVLEYLRVRQPEGWACYASSSRVFGKLSGTINETTEKRGDDLYAICKKTACELIDYYRQQHAVKCLTAHFFQHDSPQRAAGFFTTKVVDILVKSLDDPTYVGELYSLDFYCDIGSASEFMSLVVMAGGVSLNENLIFASGKTMWARDVVEMLFQHYGLDYRSHIRERMIGGPKGGAKDVPKFIADVSKMERTLGQSPQLSALDVLNEMARSCMGPS